MQTDTQKQSTENTATVARIRDVQDAASKALAGTCNFASAAELSYVAEEAFCEENAIGTVSTKVELSLSGISSEHEQHCGVWHEGVLQVAPERIEMRLQRHCRSDGRVLSHYEPTRIDVLADEWPAYRNLLLAMVAQADRLFALLPVVLPVPLVTPGCAGASVADPAPPSAPAPRGRANQGRRAGSCRSRGG